MENSISPPPPQQGFISYHFVKQDHLSHYPNRQVHTDLFLGPLIVHIVLNNHIDRNIYQVDDTRNRDLFVVLPGIDGTCHSTTEALPW